MLQDPGLVPPPEEILKLVPAGIAGALVFAAARALTRIPRAAALVAAASPVVAWWVLVVDQVGFPEMPPITMGQRSAWVLIVLAVASAVSIPWRPHPSTAQPKGSGTGPGRPWLPFAAFALRAGVLSGACVYALSTFVARAPGTEGAVPVWLPVLIGIGIAGLQQVAIVGAERCAGWQVTGALAFAIGHIGPVCVVHTTALHGQIAGALGLGIGFCVLPSLIFPSRRVPPAFAASALAAGALLALDQHYIAPTRPPAAVWLLFGLAAVAPGLVALTLGAVLDRHPRWRAFAGPSLAVLLTAAAFGLALATAPEPESSDPTDYSDLYDSFK